MEINNEYPSSRKRGSSQFNACWMMSVKWKTEVVIAGEAKNLPDSICRVSLMTEAGSSLTEINPFLGGVKTGDIEMITDRMNVNTIRIHKVSLIKMN
jgi:hypothetical protein